MRLARLPEVEWVVPNERERRLNAPTDPLFPATFSSSGQWWMFQAGGSNRNDLEDRRRGVPDLLSAWQAEHRQRRAPSWRCSTPASPPHPDLGSAACCRATTSSRRSSTPTTATAGTPIRATPATGSAQADRDAQPGAVRRLRGRRQLLARHHHRRHARRRRPATAAASPASTGAAACCRCAWPASAAPRWPTSSTACAGPPACRCSTRRPAAAAEPEPGARLNISFGGSAACNAAYQDAIDELARLGVVVVAAAGNEHGAVSRPANCRGVIGVAALNRDGFKASYSNFGAAAGHRHRRRRSARWSATGASTSATTAC